MLPIKSTVSLDGTLIREGALVERVARYVLQVFKFFGLLPVAVACHLAARVERWFYPVADSSLTEFAKRPTWEVGEDGKERDVSLPRVLTGFATADFHDHGPLARPHTNFGELYLKKFPDRFDPSSKFPDMWNNPETYLNLLKETGAKVFRFSIPRDQIEPEEGRFDEAQIQAVSKWCEQLKKAGIEPIATLEHNAHPLYQTLATVEGRGSFVRYAQRIGVCLKECGVTKIVTFNEVGVEGFQGHIMGEFPPYRSVDFEGAAKNFTHLMQTHNAVYDALKEIDPHFQIGCSHDPIRFRPYHKYNPLWSPIERLVAWVLTSVNHTMVMDAMRKGIVKLKIPGLINYEFDLGGPVKFDVSYLQYYSDPLVKLSFFGGDSVSRVKDEKTTAYRFRMYPQGMASALEEMASLGKPIVISEVGLDTGVNKGDDDHERIQYLNRISQVVKKALDEGINIQAVCYWTLTDNFDWVHGWTLPVPCPIRFGMYRFDYSTGEIAPRGAAFWFMRKRQQEALS
ncbi:MAG: hypothetical protein A3E80_04245 [Chlamydiae bacterium RIFCSPHIGHO2_12_FULL_49_9]|nr:MAG: hypothetical protein A3E80_04245 [Chlamydiae bacterium RIFCSPHIGHO2_12_FULL_49_9]